MLLSLPQMDVFCKPNFRVEHEMFHELCELLGPDLTKQETRMSKRVSLE